MEVMKKNHLCREKVRHIPGQGHSRCKGPEVNTSLAYCNWHVEGSRFSGALSPGSLFLQPITFPVALALLSLKQPNPSLDQSFSLAIPSTQNALLPLPKKSVCLFDPLSFKLWFKCHPLRKRGIPAYPNESSHPSLPLPYFNSPATPNTHTFSCLFCVLPISWSRRSAAERRPCLSCTLIARKELGIQ